MWLINSSIGRKVVMSVTGIALILFLTFHGCMNLVALFSEEGYNMICEFLGANWYAVVATLGLAALAVIHIVYAFILTAQNRTARGNNRYEVSTVVITATRWLRWSTPARWSGRRRTCSCWDLSSWLACCSTCTTSGTT